MCSEPYNVETLPLLPASAEEGAPRKRRAVTWDSTLLPTRDDVERFWSKVVRSPECWFYVGTISSPDGYGRFTFQRDNTQRTMSAHRFALLVSGVELSAGVIGEHYCNEPLCVRVDPRHLHASTQKENIAWAIATGRMRGRQPGAQAAYDRAARSRRIRQALNNGWDEEAFRTAISDIDTTGQQSLF